MSFTFYNRSSSLQEANTKKVKGCNHSAPRTPLWQNDERLRQHTGNRGYVEEKGRFSDDNTLYENKQRRKMWRRDVIQCFEGSVEVGHFLKRWVFQSTKESRDWLFYYDKNRKVIPPFGSRPCVDRWPGRSRKEEISERQNTEHGSVCWLGAWTELKG